jgi:hypothetical protein
MWGRIFGKVMERLETFNELVLRLKYPNWGKDDYANLPIHRILELASEQYGLTVNLQHCRQMKFNKNIVKAERAGYIKRKRERVYGGVAGTKQGKKRTCFHITEKGRLALHFYKAGEDNAKDVAAAIESMRGTK